MAENPKVLIAGNKGHITETQMIIGLRRKGLDIHAAYNSDSEQLATLEAAGIPTRALNLKRGLDVPNILRIRRWMRHEGFNILHGLSNQATTNFLWASYGQKNKVIAYRGATGHVSRYDPTCYLKWLNPNLDKIICVSNAVSTDLVENGVPAHKVITIYKGHDLSWYTGDHTATAGQEIRELFNIPDNVTIIGMIANMRRVKGADVLLRAMKHLPPSVHAVLIGEVRDPQITNLASTHALRGRVHLTGYRDDAAYLLPALYLNVAPSRGREGLTRAVIEGMAQGIPAIVTDAGGLPELITSGETGFVVPKDDPIQLAEKIEKLVEHPDWRDQMALACKKRVFSHFNVNTTISQTAACYHAVLSQ
ncbi:glycosyltransferase [Spiribacter pallidus]|uniref:Glycosyltransferase n=1 Tax=Spiribacter pallidus TaxID=1987936 RepID=A0ABV3TG10_9GAMM